jgi:hypothetical protein
VCQKFVIGDETARGGVLISLFLLSNREKKKVLLFICGAFHFGMLLLFERSFPNQTALTHSLVLEKVLPSSFSSFLFLHLLAFRLRLCVSFFSLLLSFVHELPLSLAPCYLNDMLPSYFVRPRLINGDISGHFSLISVTAISRHFERVVTQ